MLFNLVVVLAAGEWEPFKVLAEQPSLTWEKEGWVARSPRDEIRPQFSMAVDGLTGKTVLVIEHDNRQGLDGWFEKSIEVRGGETYQFQAFRRLTSVALPRRSALVRIVWEDEEGRQVKADVGENVAKELGHTPSAEPEHPVDQDTDPKGWTRVAGMYRAPSKATKAIIELHLQWSPQGKAEWREDVQFQPSKPIAPRRVKLASIHYKPSGKSPLMNCKEFEPFLEEASKQKVDLVVLGETIPSVNVKRMPHEIAEPIPGTTTEYFGEVADKYDLHIVLSLYEREDHLVYNTAVLIGPDGTLIGKYRKVCLPHGEVEKGVAPGSDYPVFQTRFGKVGMMVCYDGFFPEVARQLSNRGRK